MILSTISEKSNSTAQFLTVLILFVLVLGVTYVTTKWIANYQKQQSTNAGNVKLIEASRLSGGKYIQIVQIGEKYYAIAVCKDTVTLLCEVPAEEIKESPGGGSNSMNFKDVFGKILEGKNKTNFDEKQDSEEK